jgi:phosphoglycerate dehydrogenase-like enzyme
MKRPALVISGSKELLATFFPPRMRARLRRFRWKTLEGREVTPDLKSHLNDADALITTWDSPRFSDDLPTIAPRLRVIGHCGGEVKSRFHRSLFERLTITNASAPMSRPTAELGAALLLYSARNVDFYRREMAKRSNQIYDDVHLHGTSESLIGQTVSMIGFGRIGRALADLLIGFNVKWLVHDPYADRSLSKKYPVRFVSLKELLPKARLLVLTAALTKQTRGILGEKQLAALPDGATVINIARGGLIDLEALKTEVRQGRLRCAIDVTDPLEPLPVGHPLRSMKGAIMTPHVAGSGRRVREDIANVVLDDLERFFRGKPVQNRVTTAMLDRMT